MTVNTHRAGLIRANLICMATMLVWATAFPSAELLLPHVPPLPLTALRLGLGTAFVMALWVAMEGFQAVRNAPWVRGMLIGGIGFGLGSLMLVLAQQASDPVTVAVISAMMPVVGIALECAYDGRRLDLWLVAGLLLSIVGGVLAYAAKIGEMGFGLGAFFALVSVTAFAIASRLTITQLPGLSPIAGAAVTLAGAVLSTGVASIIAWLAGGPQIAWGAFGATEWTAMFVYGVLSLGLSQVLWVAGVSGLGIGVAAMHVNAAPFYVMVFMMALGTPWNWMQAFGALVVAIAVVVAQQSRPALSNG